MIAKMPIALLALFALPLPALAADVSGTWKAEFNTQRGIQKYTFTFKQEGPGLTGKASVEREGEKREADLKEGKVEGDNVSFVEILSLGGNDLRITFSGKLARDER